MAAFGTTIDEALKIQLSLHAPDRDDELGCHLQPLQPRRSRSKSDGTSQLDNWILLMRGECSFVDKVRRAQAAGYDGVIVGDDGSAYDSLITMFARGADDVVVPALFVTHASYTLLQETGTSRSKLSLTISTNEIRTDWPLLDTLIFICFSPLCTLFIVYVVLYFRRRRLHLNNILPPAYLSKLETVEYLAKDGVNAECVICLDTFVEAESVLELPCKHFYHAHCIRKWLIERKKLCPICKRDVSVGIDVRQGRISESQVESAATALPRIPVSAVAVTETTPLLQSGINGGQMQSERHDGQVQSGINSGQMQSGINDGQGTRATE